MQNKIFFKKFHYNTRTFNLKFCNKYSQQLKQIDLRSDTVTRPSQKMKNAIETCAVGDDVYGDDPTMNLFQTEIANFFGKEQAIFMVSGTQSNLCAMLTSCKQKGDSAILGDKCHINMYERGGLAAIGNIFPTTIKNFQDGTFDLNQLRQLIPPQSEHIAQPKVICLENSHGGCMGATVPLEFVQSVQQIAKQKNLRTHLDGARILNAVIEQKIDVKTYVKEFNTVSFCLSKGMGCPVGSVLLGSEQDIWFAKNMRKMIGGGMRQTGILAVCGLVALEDWELQLRTDNQNAKYLANILSDIDGINCDPEKVQTNMLCFMINQNIQKLDHLQMSQILKQKYNILVLPSFNNDFIRIVTHRDVSQQDMEITKMAIQEIVQQFT